MFLLLKNNRVSALIRKGLVSVIINIHDIEMFKAKLTQDILLQYEHVLRHRKLFSGESLRSTKMYAFQTCYEKSRL